MKKFSKITNSKIGEEPKVEIKKLNEEEIFKSKVSNLIDNYLKIQTYGPIDRYLRAGNIKITGKEMFLEAIMSLLSDETTKYKKKLLEGLKSNIKDWEFIDSKINDIDDTNEDFRSKYNLNRIIERYSGDQELLSEVLQEKINKISSKSILETYSKYLQKSNIINKEKLISSIDEKLRK
jgi:hypothetical protein